MQPEMQSWVRSQLDVLAIVPVRQRPWAGIWRVDTATTRWWAKANSAATGYEPRLLSQLQALSPELLPACHPHERQPWGLTMDAGQPAHELLAGADAVAVLEFWCDLLPKYARLQQAVHADDLTRLGVPDLRPGRLLDAFDELLADRRWFTGVSASSDAEEIRRRVASVRPQLVEVTAELAAGVAATLQHDDLHGSNVFVSTGQVRIIDWGDAVVAHPFSTLRVTLDGLADQLRLDRASVELARVEEAYLDAWPCSGGSTSDLRRQLQLALQVAALGRALGWARALGSPELAVEFGFGDAVPTWLERLANDLVAGRGAARR